MKYLLIFFGGGIGSVLRYILAGLVHRFAGSIFPWGTLFINVSGSFAIGFLWALAERSAFSPNLRLFLFIGILGGFTTFSSFSLETMNLIHESELKLAAANIFFTNALCIATVFAGYMLSKTVLEIK